MGSPAGCGFYFRQIHLNMIQGIQLLALRAENTAGRCWRRHCHLHTRHNVCGPLLPRKSVTATWPRPDLCDDEKLNQRRCESVTSASVSRSIPLQERLEKDL